MWPCNTVDKTVYYLFFLFIFIYCYSSLIFRVSFLYSPPPQALVCTYNRLVCWEFLPNIEHEQHETDETKQLFAHCGPGYRAGRCIHTVPDVHVKMPVHLKIDREQSLFNCNIHLCFICVNWYPKATVSIQRPDNTLQTYILHRCSVSLMV